MGVVLQAAEIAAIRASDLARWRKSPQGESIPFRLFVDFDEFPYE
jgi:hypothetical protein